MRRIVALVLAGGVMGLAGCGAGQLPAPAAVRGTVTFHGRPLMGGLIVFAPDRDKGNVARSASATIGADGSYTLTVDGTMAVAPGWYRVAIADPPGVFTADAGFPRFPAPLRRPDRSGLSREVLPGKDNVFLFDIEVTE